MSKNLKRVSVILIIALVLVTSLFANGVKEYNKVKVLEIGMFEVGENKGDFSGEFQHFYEKYFDGAQEFKVKGLANPLYLNDDGVAGFIAGMGKAQAAEALTAVLCDGRFDFSDTYIVVSGCAGGPPSRVTLGDVIVATKLVDYELGHAWQQSDIPAGTTDTFMRANSYDRSAYFEVNEDLVNASKLILNNVELTDGDKATAYRALYGQDSSVKPSIKYGVSVTGDNYWHGKASSEHADEVVAAYTSDDKYMVTQMEDSAFGVVANNFGLADHLVVVRDVVNFDQPHSGQTVLESLDTSSGGFSIGMTNGFIVASTLIDAILDNYDELK